MIGVINKQDSTVSEFERIERDLSGSKLAWVKAIRKSAMSRFLKLGFPTRRNEQWQFTDIRPITEIPFKLGMKVDFDVTRAREIIAAYPFGAIPSHQLVFVNGNYSPELSSLQGGDDFVVGNLATFFETDLQDVVESHLARYADVENHAFTALNTAFFHDGAFIRLPKGRAVNLPVHLIFVSSALHEPLVSHPRVLIVAEPDAQAAIIESYIGQNGEITFTNSVTEIAVGENARIDHYKLEWESPKALHIHTIQVQQDRNSRFTSHSISAGGALVRNDLNVIQAAEGTESTLNGLTLLAGRQHVDNHTTIDHTKSHGTSRELYKGVLDGSSQAIFNGTIIVRPNAQKTDAMQTNKNLLLSERGLVNSKPELQIYANDVKCKHGATVGQIDPDQMFYLRARGLGEMEARRLLIHAFASEMISRLELEPLRVSMEVFISNWLVSDRRDSSDVETE